MPDDVTFLGAFYKITNTTPDVYITSARLTSAFRPSIECPTTYQTRHFFNNSKTNEDTATKQTHTTDTFLFISHTTNVLLFKSRCNIFIGFRIIKEMSGLVGSGTPCISNHSSFFQIVIKIGKKVLTKFV